ncbi:MAG: Wzt carbohydrate-binding domain-containing protein [Myxococcota bacterium]|jgi:lipopolysaccharide transport system ATP-binding protein|nr:Wzt carbohydrate-binding domain-containing protein [Myxococcota bacterium]
MQVDHIDTPVKRYSSGMRMRLGFAVAAFLDTEIRFVDEVLAVGDAEFRRKCLGKMGSIANEGRTVLFVSHNMSAISNLCTRAILIDDGRCIQSGEPRDLIQVYLDRSAADSDEVETGVFDLTQRSNAYGNRELIVRKVELLDAEMRPSSCFEIGEKLFVRVHVDGMADTRGNTIGLIIKDNQDRWICDINNLMSCAGIKQPRSQREVATLEIDRLPLVPGSYPLAVSISTGGPNGRRDFVECAARIEVIDSDIYGSGASLGRSKGVTYLEGRWRIEGGDAATGCPGRRTAFASTCAAPGRRSVADTGR